MQGLEVLPSPSACHPHPTSPRSPLAGVPCPLNIPIPVLVEQDRLLELHLLGGYQDQKSLKMLFRKKVLGFGCFFFDRAMDHCQKLQRSAELTGHLGEKPGCCHLCIMGTEMSVRPCCKMRWGLLCPPPASLPHPGQEVTCHETTGHLGSQKGLED